MYKLILELLQRNKIQKNVQRWGEQATYLRLLVSNAENQKMLKNSEIQELLLSTNSPSHSEEKYFQFIN